MMTHLDLGSDEVAIEKLPVLDPVKLANLLSRLRVVHLATFLATLLLERHFSEVSDGCSQLEGIRLFLGAEAEGVEGNVGELYLLGVVDRVDLDLALREEEVVVRVRAHQDKLLEAINDARLDKLEEDVVAPLVGLLVGHTGLLEKVDINEATGKLSHVVEVDSDEFTKARRVVIPDGFCVAIGLQNWVRVDDPVLKIRLLDLVLGGILGLQPSEAPRMAK